jgi:tetratricopeptide (TPR) repeat protein
MKAAVPLLAAFLVALGAPSAEAQVGSVRGIVKDQSGHPVKGATVSIESGAFTAKYSATTDKKGRFVVLGLGTGEWIFSVEAPGFETVRARANLRALQKNPDVEIRLTHAAIPSSLGMNGREIQQRIDAAEAAAARGDLDGAIAGYSDLVSRVPALTSIQLQLGALYERKGDSAAALAAYRRLAELEPENAKARAAIERLSGQSRSK